MDALEKYRRDEARRLICWIRNHKNRWQDILTAVTEQDASVVSELKRVIRDLRDNGFYQLIVLLLYTRNEKIQKMIENTLLSTADEYWDDELPDRVIEILLDNLGG